MSPWSSIILVSKHLMAFQLIRPKNNPLHNRFIANPSYLQLNYFKQISQTPKDLLIIWISLFAGHNKIRGTIPSSILKSTASILTPQWANYKTSSPRAKYLYILSYAKFLMQSKEVVSVSKSWPFEAFWIRGQIDWRDEGHEFLPAQQ